MQLHTHLLNLLLLFSSQQMMAGSTPMMIQDTSHPDISTIVIEPEPTEDIIYFHSRSETMPRFPGCEDLEGTTREKKHCSDQKMLQYIYSKLTYPVEAQQNGVEGMAVINFTVNKNGRLEQFKILRDPRAGTGAEALRVIKSMNDLPAPWIPGTQNGKIVAVQYNMPIRFKLSTIELDEEENKEAPIRQ